MASPGTIADAALFAPGAGSDRDHATLVAIERGLMPMPVTRMDFPYRIAGRKAPDRAPVLIAAVRERLDELATRVGIATDRILLGGRSMGGRMCSMLAADPQIAVAGLVLISYPLHPPGKPERLRVEHLPALSVPVLFISGTRDPFGTPAELREATQSIPGSVRHHWIEGGRHDLKGADDEIVATISDWLSTP